MTSMILGKRLGRLESVDLRTYWADEARDFTPWLATVENLDVLSSTLGLDLEREGVEVPVGPYKADIVARDLASGIRVIIENQLERTNHDHLGKTITYASGLDAKVIIWIAREFSEEHRRAIDFLNEHAAPNLRLFALEIQLWRIGDSLPAPMFRVVASPNDYTSAIKVENDELSETKILYLEFWNAFKEFSTARGTFLSLRKPRPQHWYNIAVGRSKFSIALTVSTQKKRLGCSIYLRGAFAKKAFKALERDKSAIEHVTGSLEWQELPEGQDCRIVRYRPEIDIADRGTWNDAFTWLKQEAELLHKAFSPRIKALPTRSGTNNGSEEDEVDSTSGNFS